jgi:hypothetical protein
MSASTNVPAAQREPATPMSVEELFSAPADDRFGPRERPIFSD